MAEERKHKRNAIARWLDKRRHGWKRAGEMDRRARETRKRDETRHGGPRGSGDPPIGGGF